VRGHDSSGQPSGGVRVTNAHIARRELRHGVVDVFQGAPLAPLVDEWLNKDSPPSSASDRRDAELCA
jgi:hypothetical protein